MPIETQSDPVVEAFVRKLLRMLKAQTVQIVALKFLVAQAGGELIVNGDGDIDADLAVENLPQGKLRVRFVPRADA